eukprot:384229-Prymnesium_polylepis.1
MQKSHPLQPSRMQCWLRVWMSHQALHSRACGLGGTTAFSATVAAAGAAFDVTGAAVAAAASAAAVALRSAKNICFTKNATAVRVVRYATAG